MRHQRDRLWLGGLILAGLMGFAIGNGHETRAALDGSADWWARTCAAHVKAVVRQHQQEDRDTFGFAPEDLEASKR